MKHKTPVVFVTVLATAIAAFGCKREEPQRLHPVPTFMAGQESSAPQKKLTCAELVEQMKTILKNPKVYTNYKTYKEFESLMLQLLDLVTQRENIGSQIKELGAMLKDAVKTDPGPDPHGRDAIISGLLRILQTYGRMGGDIREATDAVRAARDAYRGSSLNGGWKPIANLAQNVLDMCLPQK